MSTQPSQLLWHRYKHRDVVNANYNSDFFPPSSSDDETEGPAGLVDDESSSLHDVDTDTEEAETSDEEKEATPEEEEEAQRDETNGNETSNSKRKHPSSPSSSPIAKRLRKQSKVTIPIPVLPPLNHGTQGTMKKKSKVVTPPPASPASSPNVKTKKKKKPIHRQRRRFKECAPGMSHGPSCRDDLAPAGHFDRTTFNKRNKF